MRVTRLRLAQGTHVRALGGAPSADIYPGRTVGYAGAYVGGVETDRDGVLLAVSAGEQWTAVLVPWALVAEVELDAEAACERAGWGDGFAATVPPPVAPAPTPPPPVPVVAAPETPVPLDDEEEEEPAAPAEPATAADPASPLALVAPTPDAPKHRRGR